MSGHKARPIRPGMNIPCAAHVQCCSVWRQKLPVHRITHSMCGSLCCDNIILASMSEQCVGQIVPVGRSETKAQKESRFASTSGMCGIKQIVSNFLLRDSRQMRVGQLHWFCMLPKRGSTVAR